MSKTEERLPEFHDRAPPDRYCDLVLTGGITSAIAYPATVIGLASAYRFNCIGGSSSGAGIAALAAAAEYRRRHGSPEGFRILLRRTSALRDDAGGQTNLAALFQPSPRARRLFHVFVQTAAAATVRRRMLAFAAALLSAYRWPATAAIAVAVAIVWAVSHWYAEQGLLAYLALSLLFVPLFVGVAVLCDTDKGLIANRFGMCTGGPDPDGATANPPLTVWLHELIQEIAGRKPGDAPLTFGDLWNAPGSPRETLGGRAPPGTRSIDLQMFTANVTHGRPYLLPETDFASRLFFRRADLQGLFPDPVIDHLIACSEPYRPAGPHDPSVAKVDPEFRELPSERLPIIVAARLSLSFPLLFSAVPLWAIDYEPKPDDRRLERCWFSDGGLCSNFPIHLFDSAVPAWPTFGISLADASPHWLGDDDRVWLPEHHRQGRADRWRRFDEGRPLSRLTGFLGALLLTAKDWNDAMLARMPGVRDRVVRVGLTEGEGGLNLHMTKPQIDRLAGFGRDAAKLLLERFAKPSAAGGLAQGWNEHRWVRVNVLLRSLKKSLDGLAAAAAFDRYAQPIGEQVEEAIRSEPLQGDQGSLLLAAQAAALRGLLAALEKTERTLATQALEQPYDPVPEPVLRVRPPL